MENKSVNYSQAKYKIVELATVTDETIEYVLNHWVGQGWQFDQIQFVVRDASRRPSMAFVFFVKQFVEDDPDPVYQTEKFEKEDLSE